MLSPFVEHLPSCACLSSSSSLHPWLLVEFFFCGRRCSLRIPTPARSVGYIYCDWFSDAWPCTTTWYAGSDVHASLAAGCGWSAWSVTGSASSRQVADNIWKRAQEDFIRNAQWVDRGLESTVTVGMSDYKRRTVEVLVIFSMICMIPERFGIILIYEGPCTDQLNQSTNLFQNSVTITSQRSSMLSNWTVLKQVIQSFEGAGWMEKWPFASLLFSDQVSFSSLCLCEM